MTDLIIDASVAIKWVIEEPGTAEALALRKYRLSAPELLVSECANVLWKKVRRNELSGPEALIAARLLERADIDLVPMRNLLEPATKLAIALNHPAYDCIYVALAEATNTMFITADELLARRLRATGTTSRVVFLGSAIETIRGE